MKNINKQEIEEWVNKQKTMHPLIIKLIRNTSGWIENNPKKPFSNMLPEFSDWINDGKVIADSKNRDEDPSKDEDSNLIRYSLKLLQ